MVMKTIRKLLGMEKFEMPREPDEFYRLRPILESHLRGGWTLGKTPEHTAIQVQLSGKTVPALLKQQLEEVAEYYGFEVNVYCPRFRG